MTSAADRVPAPVLVLAGIVSVQFGGALMLAIAAAVNVSVTGDDPSRAAMLDGYRAALIVPLAAVLVGGIVTASGLRRPVGARGTGPVEGSGAPAPAGAEAA